MFTSTYQGNPIYYSDPSGSQTEEEELNSPAGGKAAPLSPSGSGTEDDPFFTLGDITQGAIDLGEVVVQATEKIAKEIQEIKTPIKTKLSKVASALRRADAALFGQGERRTNLRGFQQTTSGTEGINADQVKGKPSRQVNQDDLVFPSGFNGVNSPLDVIPFALGAFKVGQQIGGVLPNKANGSMQSGVTQEDVKKVSVKANNNAHGHIDQQEALRERLLNQVGLRDISRVQFDTGETGYAVTENNIARTSRLATPEEVSKFSKFVK